jgi:pimeloyl-ACP methyl ester carboxylesterase
VPGAFATHDALFPLVSELERDHRVIAMSIHPDVESLEEFSTAVDAVMRAEGVTRAHFIGVSFGGWLAQQIATTRRELVCSLILIHSFALSPRERQRLRWVAPLAGAVVRRAPRRLLNALLRRRVHRLLISPLMGRRYDDVASWRKLLEECVADGTLRKVILMQPMMLIEGVPGTFAGPALIVQSSDDPAIPDGVRAALRRQYATARVITLPNTGHIAPIVATGQVATAIRAFVLGIERQVAASAGAG